ncbi:MAG: DUF427 domain-containing protein [Solirubrobacterales bacterium]|nr:DUF427 domain-containing protein [Solirubrobacterales bacterium]
MATRVRAALMRELGELRYEPIEKRIRASLGGREVIDSTRAMLVWEPKRVVPSYAVPVDDLDGELIAPAARADADAAAEAIVVPQLAGRPVYDPSVPFAVHTAEGQPLDLNAHAGVREGAAFRPADDVLSGYVIVDFGAFDAWYEEDELNVAHPRDPFRRIDIVHSSRHVRIERDGAVLAESTSPYMLFEPPLPVRYYLPASDVSLELLTPSATRTYCAYKGQASYWSIDEEDIAWTYREPLREAAEVTDRIAFFNERVTLRVDGRELERPVTPWSRR